MKKQIIVLVIAGLFILNFKLNLLATDVTWQNIGRENLNLRTLLIDLNNPSIIYIGSAGAVSKSEDGGINWRRILSVKGQNRVVNFLLFDPRDKNSLYAATGGGLFCSSNQGKNWSRIFKGKNYLENECIALAILSDTIYLGTRRGLFVSRDTGRSWHRETGKIGDSNILAIACNPKEPDYIYVACLDGVFKTQNKGQSWERIFVANPQENGNLDIEEEMDDQDEEERFSGIRYISIGSNNANCLYLATSRGMYRSQDRGLTWQSFSTYGLLSQDVRFLLVSKNSEAYAVTNSGVFEYKTDRWQELSFNLSAGEVRFLALDKQNNLYAACDKGLFKANKSDFNNGREENIISLYFQSEPKIDEVQQAAIKYAEVEPGKIIKWRKQAARKALLPQVSVGIDRNVTDLWHWEGGSTTKTDDDILRRGRDSIDWDVALSWNLGELIWNDDQTSIDVRSRLMVQLRQDILDEATKLYFERARVKMELDNLSIEDRKKRFEKELRLEELTASLDALTGGYFSKAVNKDKG